MKRLQIAGLLILVVVVSIVAFLSAKDRQDKIDRVDWNVVESIKDFKGPIRADFRFILSNNGQPIPESPAAANGLTGSMVNMDGKVSVVIKEFKYQFILNLNKLDANIDFGVPSLDCDNLATFSIQKAEGDAFYVSIRKVCGDLTIDTDWTIYPFVAPLVKQL